TARTEHTDPPASAALQRVGRRLRRHHGAVFRRICRGGRPTAPPVQSDLRRRVRTGRAAGMNVYFLNTIQSGLDLYERVRGDVPVTGFIGLSSDRDTAHISGFASAEATCRRDGLAYHEIRDYALRDPADRALLE